MQYPLPRFRHRGALSHAWTILRSHPRLFIYPTIIALLTCGLSIYTYRQTGVIVAGATPEAEPTLAIHQLQLTFGFSLGSSLLSLCLCLLLGKQILRLFAEGEPEAQPLGRRIRKGILYLLQALLLILITGFASLFILLPGFYLATRLSLTPWLYLDGKAGFWGSFKLSWQRTARHFYVLLPMWGFALLFTIGVVATLGLGLIPLLPLGMLYLCILYRYLLEIPQETLPRR